MYAVGKKKEGLKKMMNKMSTNGREGFVGEGAERKGKEIKRVSTQRRQGGRGMCWVRRKGRDEREKG